LKLKKSHITLIVIFIVLIIAGALYYFYYLPQEQTVVVQVSESEANTSEELETTNKEDAESKDDTQRDVEQADGDGNIEKSEEVVEEDSRQEEEKVVEEGSTKEDEELVVAEEEKQEPQIDYTYREGFQNPFKDYRIIKKDIEGDNQQLTIAAIKEMVPFTLTGIIGNSQERLAVPEYQGKTSIIKGKTVIEDFTIVNILAEELVMSYKGVQFKIEMGSGIGEIL